MQFRILGPLEVRSAEGTVEIRGVKRRALLAALLLHPGQVVSVNRLVETLWEEAPRSAASNIRTYVADLRASLGALRVVSHSSGYLIRVEPGELDLLLFETLADKGRQAAKDGDAPAAAITLERAAGLWRGEPLAGMELGAWAQARITLLDDLRWGVLSALVEAEMALGRYEELIVRLRLMLEERPLCERTWAQLMVALYHLGRKAEALVAFAQAREILTRELGLEPCPELREVQRGILAGRKALPWSSHHYTPPPSPATPPGRPLPHGVAGGAGAGVASRAGVASGGGGASGAGGGASGDSGGGRRACHLSPVVAGLVGRAAELGEITGALTRPPGAPGGAAVVALSGSPGAGKTVLLLRAAHELAPRFADGRLDQVLCGSTAHPKPVSAVLAEFLCSLGVPPRRQPAGVEDRAALYRSLLAGRRVLIVLDDVEDGAQLRPLLPGPGACRVLAAGRTRLTSLDGVRPVRVGPLAEESAIELLGDLIGDDRADREPGEVRRIAAACAGLPLALWIAGTRLAVRPSWPLARLAERLADESVRLKELAIGELSVQAAFAAGYAKLSPLARRVSWLAGSLPPEQPVVLPGSPDGVVAELVQANLLVPVEGGYRLDDLFRLYVRGRAETGEPPDRPHPGGRPTAVGAAVGSRGEADGDA
ncbi:BTAD domain-containing putative transcriptional regulator [Nonomuraea spiralis]|uniref:AfsR/SARP family transcriptional regulator n=1 Tax=Nonomuraea spiralis TaxID=46182 RepID=UPI0037902CF8